MFTNNYIKYRNQMFRNLYYSRNALKAVDGVTIYCDPKYGRWADFGVTMRKAFCLNFDNTATTTSEPTGPYFGQGVYFGSGSTPASKADYKLESPITSGLTITNPTVTNDDIPLMLDGGNGKYTLYANYTVQNTTASEINIYEVGCFGEVVYLKNGTYYRGLVLFERTVLTEPITIAPGDMKVITYKLTFNQTLNVE